MKSWTYVFSGYHLCLHKSIEGNALKSLYIIHQMEYFFIQMVFDNCCNGFRSWEPSGHLAGNAWEALTGAEVSQTLQKRKIRQRLSHFYGVFVSNKVEISASQMGLLHCVSVSKGTFGLLTICLFVSLWPKQQK